MMTADRPATEPRPDYSGPGVTIDQLLAEGWRPDGHRNIPHTLDEDECWCNESRAEAAQGGAPLDHHGGTIRVPVEVEWRNDEAYRRGYDAALAAQGAAPRAEGLDVEAVLLRILTVCGGEGDDPTDVALAFQMIRDTVDDALARLSEGAAPRAEGLDVPPHSCASVEQEVELLSARNDSLVAELQHVKDSPAWKQLSRALQDRITRAIEARR